MVYKPTVLPAPATAVTEVIKTFRGQWYPALLDSPGDYTSAQFGSRSDLDNALHLVNMLGGWSAEQDPDTPLALRVWQEL
jgi:hypothetical protein